MFFKDMPRAGPTLDRRTEKVETHTGAPAKGSPRDGLMDGLLSFSKCFLAFSKSYAMNRYRFYVLEQN